MIKITTHALALIVMQCKEVFTTLTCYLALYFEFLTYILPDLFVYKLYNIFNWFGLLRDVSYSQSIKDT